MRFRASLALALLLVATTQAWAQKQSAKKVSFKDDQEKVSYAIGMQLGKGFRTQDAKIDIDALARGVQDALDNKARLSDDECETVIETYEEEIAERMATKNKEQGEKFLADNKKKDGVKVTKSGLQYKVLKNGKGKSPKKTDIVTTQYTGTFIDGTEFDSSEKRGKPAQFALTQVIAGWNEALQQMPVGSKWRIYVPSELAYGEQGRPPIIGPNAVLVFDLELLGIGQNSGEEVCDEQ